MSLRGIIFQLQHSAATGSIIRGPKIFILDVAEIYQRHWFEESGQRLDNVDRTHLELAT